MLLSSSPPLDMLALLGVTHWPLLLLADSDYLEHLILV